MRLTIINQFYLPDVSPTAKLAAALANHRASIGDEVSVIASQGAYAADHHGTDHPLEDAPHKPRVFRTRALRLGAGAFWRCLSFAVFTLSAAARMLTLRRQDLIIALTTPPFIAWIAILHKLLHPGTQVILWSMDCYPEVAERAGALRENGLVSRLLRLQNRVLLGWVDHIVCLETEMLRLLQRNYSLDPAKLSIANNWESGSLAEAVRAAETGHNSQTRQDGEPLVALYAGNMGTGHQFDTVLEAARAVNGEPFQFVFNGGGSRRPEVEEQIQQWGLKNTEFRGYVAKEELPALLASADVGLITLRDSMLGVMSPSKLYTNLAAGLPVIYVGPPNSHVDEVIQRFDCGVSLRHGDWGGLRDFLRTLHSDPRTRQWYRQRSRLAYEMIGSEKNGLSMLDAAIALVREPAEQPSPEVAADRKAA